MAPRVASFPSTLGPLDLRSTPVLHTDVVVIGGGIAGGRAALAAAEQGATVLLLTKTAFEETNTAYAQGGMAVVLEQQDSIGLHVADTLRVGAGLADRTVAERVLARSGEVLEWLLSIDARFDRGDDGRYSLSREGGHSVERVVHSHGDATGAEIQRVLGAAVAAHPGITVKVGSFVRDLLCHEGRCCGAMAEIDDVLLAIEAGAVILATGGSGQVYRETTNPIGATGDGVALAFRAGARLKDLEFFQFHPTTLYIAGAARFLISEVVRGAGATLVDRDGVRFMAGDHEMAELAPRDVVSRAILRRMVATGDTNVYLDLSTVGGDPRERFPSIARICSAFDIDIARDPIPVRPGAHYLIGGVRTDGSGRTNVPGLFAVGEVAATDLHGANRLASNSLLEGAVFGVDTGRAAATEALGENGIPLPRRIDVEDPPANAPRILHEDLLYSLKSLMWRQVGLERQPEGLAEARERIAFWHHYLMRSRLEDRRSWELANMLTLSALIAEAGSARGESRGVHYRRDLPARDDGEWCRHIVLERREDGPIAAAPGPLLTPSDRTPDPTRS